MIGTKDTDRATHVRRRDGNAYELHKTCSFCPEQYDVFLAGEQVGYLRARHGHFSAEHPICFAEEVFESIICGDGHFEECERDAMLDAAIDAIHARVIGAPQP